MLSRLLSRILITAIAALFAAYVLNGVHIAGVGAAIMLSVVLALLNTFIKPVLIFFTFPITIVTLGLFLIIINILMIKWAAELVEGFRVDGWWAAFLFSIIVSVITGLLEGLAAADNKKK